VTYARGRADGRAEKTRRPCYVLILNLYKETQNEHYTLLNLGCLHPVARVKSYDVGFNPSTQRHYRRLSDVA
jgi:hypothetical protein